MNLDYEGERQNENKFKACFATDGMMDSLARLPEDEAGITFVADCTHKVTERRPLCKPFSAAGAPGSDAATDESSEHSSSEDQERSGHSDSSSRGSGSAGHSDSEAAVDGGQAAAEPKAAALRVGYVSAKAKPKAKAKGKVNAKAKGKSQANKRDETNALITCIVGVTLMHYTAGATERVNGKDK